MLGPVLVGNSGHRGVHHVGFVSSFSRYVLSVEGRDMCDVESGIQVLFLAVTNAVRRSNGRSVAACRRCDRCEG